MKYSIIIPTRNRFDDLHSCLCSIIKQTIVPHELIIVDDGDLTDEQQTRLSSMCENGGIMWRYIKKDHTIDIPGTSRSRNMGMALAQSPIAFILDDDLILENQFSEYIVDVWNKYGDDKHLIAVGGVITNNRVPSRLEYFYRRLGGLHSSLLWDVNDAAFQVWDDGITEVTRGYYMHGGVCGYHVERTIEIGGFAEYGKDRTALEDVDFCLRAKRLGYHMYMQPLSRVIHNHSPSGREHSSLSGFKEGRNRKLIWYSHGRKGLRGWLWFVHANIFWTVRAVITGKFSKAWGMVRGLFTPVTSIN